MEPRSGHQPKFLEAVFGWRGELAMTQGGLHPPSRDPEERNRPIRASEVFGFAILAMIAAVIFRQVFHSVNELATDFTQAVPSRIGRNLIGVAVIASLGWGLSMLRSRRRLLYATIELGCACAVAWTATSRIGQSSPGAWVAPLSAAYLFVRGLENLKAGLAALPHPEPVAPLAQTEPALQ